MRATGLGVRLVLLGGLVVLLASVPWWRSSSNMRDLVELFTLLALAQMWNLLAGFSGLVSIGQQAFVGLGAYGIVVLTTEPLGIHPFLAVPIAGLIAAALSLPMAALAFRLRGGYFAIGTWVIAEVVRLLTLNWQHVGGGDGTTILAAASIERGMRERWTYLIALALAVMAVLGAYALLRSRVGLALESIRDDEIAARAMGVDVVRTKLVVWVVAALGCGLAGAVVALNLLRVQPESAYSINWTAFMIFIVVIGGIGTIEGPILGTILFFVLQRELAQYGSWYLILIGAIAVGVAVWARGGLWGLVAQRTHVRLFPVQRRLRD